MFRIALVALLCVFGVSDALKICAFNIQTYGATKASNSVVMNHITNIVMRYDMVLIQEIRDSTGTAIIQLLDQVNSISVEQYDITQGARQGRSSYKEQYAIFYKVNYFSVISAYDYVDVGDLFEREPYIVRFSSPTTSLKEFSYVAIHAKPDDAVAEIDLLTDVYDSIVADTGNDNVIIAGDFNADCSYVDPASWNSIRLNTDSRFRWIISRFQDTTVSGNTHCAYDRIVLGGAELQNTASEYGEVFYFDEAYGLDYTAANMQTTFGPCQAIGRVPNHPMASPPLVLATKSLMPSITLKD